jgi:DNA invertase Pin-like site-specific DNA recombinase
LRLREKHHRPNSQAPSRGNVGLFLDKPEKTRHLMGGDVDHAVRALFDTLVVWKLDRLSRSLKDLLVILERIESAGGKFRSLTESIDTSGPAGRMMMQMLGSFAEFEREMIRERTRAGLREARTLGRVPGRKPKITAEQRKEIVEAVSSGRKTAAEMARLFKIHRATISRFISQARADEKSAPRP